MKFIFTGKRFFVFPIFILSIVLGSNYYQFVLYRDHSHTPSASSLSRSPSTPVREEITAVIHKPAAQANRSIAVKPAIAAPKSLLPTLAQFKLQVFSGKKNDLRGIYVNQLMALRVVQPGGDPAYISTDDGTVTQFYRAALFGVTGLLAHNFLSGRFFMHLKMGENLVLVYGDGSSDQYRVSDIADYQRLTRTDIRSNFRELGTNQEWSSDQVFARFYQNANRLTLQTCIAQDGAYDWGVRFISAEHIP